MVQRRIEHMSKVDIFKQAVRMFGKSQFTKEELKEKADELGFDSNFNSYFYDFKNGPISKKTGKYLFKEVAKNRYVCQDFADDNALTKHEQKTQLNNPKKDKKTSATFSKSKCIILNKSFTGEWLKQSDGNIAHEIINFFKADDNKIYIYNTPYGANVRGSKNLDIKYLYLTTSKTNGMYFIEYCIVIKDSLHNCSFSKEKQNIKHRAELQAIISNGKDEINRKLKHPYTDITYGETPVDQLFEDNILVFPFTFTAKKVYRAKNPIPVDEKNIGGDYDFARNFGYVLDTKQKTTFKYLFDIGPEKNRKQWKKCDLPKFTMLTHSEKNRLILKTLDQDSFLDMVDNFKMEECYTKIISSLMEAKPSFVNCFLNKIDKNLKIQEEFKITNEKAIKDYGRIDIYAENKKTKKLVIIENKIDSSITINKKNKSQLLRYYKWVKQKKKGWEPIYLILAPDYRLKTIESEVNFLQKKERFANYHIVGYSKLLLAFQEIKKQKEFDSYKFKKYLDDIELLLLRMSLEQKDLYTAKITKRILSLR